MRDPLPLPRRLGAAFWLVALSPALGAQEPGIRAEIAEGPFWIGERIALRVEVLSPTWFAGATTFELPEVPGGVLLQVADRPVVSSETIDGNTYSVQRHELALFLQREGSCAIPPITARFGVAGPPGQEPAELKLETAELTAELRRPPGAEGLAYLVSTTELVVRETWDPDPGEATVGDAFTRRITRRAPDLPAMAFPPLPAIDTPGLAAYPKPPTVRDRTERGEFTGEREDTITYVCERAGELSLPALAISWWDTDGEVLRREVLDGVTFVVAPGPEEPREEGGSATPVSGGAESPWWFAALGLLALAAALGAWQRPALVAWLSGRRKRREATEAAHFARLRQACRRGDASATLSDLYAWLKVASGASRTPTLAELVERAPDPELAHALEELQGAVVNRESIRLRRELESALRGVRARLHRRGREPRVLPPLNPT